MKSWTNFVLLTAVFMSSLGNAQDVKDAQSNQSFTVTHSLNNASPATASAYPSWVKKKYEVETTQFPGRIIYLNGVNISSLRNQELQNVKVKIDDNGNVQIHAPHYEALQDTSFHPLIPKELPRFPKAQFTPQDAPEGRFSKETGLPIKQVSPGDVVSAKELPAEKVAAEKIPAPETPAATR